MARYQMNYGMERNIRHFKIFGADASVHIIKRKQRKFDPKSRKGFWVYFPEKRKISLLCDVIFQKDPNTNVKAVESEEASSHC